MGDPRKRRKTYSRPKKPWDKERLDAEKIIVNEYGIQAKSEIYKMNSLLKKFAFQAKKLISLSTAQAEQEKKALLSKLHSLALVGANAQLDDVLALQLKDLMERRLQTIVLRKGFASTIKQARQFITHNHIKVNGKLINSPSYVVSKAEEAKLTFAENSSLANPEHPERPEAIHKAKKPKKEEKIEAKEEKKAESKEEVKKEKIEEKKEAKHEAKAEEPAKVK